MKKEKLFMVVASYVNSFRNNLEIVDFNLTKKEADNLFLAIKREQAHITSYDDDEKIELTAQGSYALYVFEQKERM